MQKPSHQDVMDLLAQLIVPFYFVERDMFVAAQPGARLRAAPENDAEHSWSLVMVACTLAPHVDPTLDIGLVSQFAAVHDLVEVFSKDVSVWADEETLRNKARHEKQALQKIQNDFAKFPWITDTLAAYESQKSNEAKYVRAIDKYIALCIRFMDGGAEYHKQGITKQDFDKALQVHRDKAHAHPGAAAYYEKIREAYDRHPEHFPVKKR